MRKFKYNNKKVEFDGHIFDSKRECDHYKFLIEQQNNNLIYDLQLQVKFELIPRQVDENGKFKHRPVCYIADFVFFDNNGVKHVQDSKGMKTDVYKLKKKLMYFINKIDVEEV